MIGRTVLAGGLPIERVDNEPEEEGDEIVRSRRAAKWG